MILPFSQYYDKEKLKPTFFAEKICKTFMLELLNPDELLEFYESDIIIKLLQPKLHTIREDKKNRWIIGRKIHSVYYHRSKYQYQFWPTFICKGIQKIVISANYHHIFVDDKELSNNELNQLAINDGFESIDDFFNWFNTDFTGKIIHFTDLKY